MTAVSKRMSKAIREYDMLQQHDKVIVAVSGGKDSMSLVKLLKYHQKISPIKFKLMAVHIDFGIVKIPIDEMEKFVKGIGVDFYIEKNDVFKGKKMKDLNCFWCSWNRKKTLFEVADRLSFNKIAFGHHMDDIIETTLLNLFYNGEISTMMPVQEFFEGKFTVIRPFAYERERNLKRLLKTDNIPDIDKYKCPNNDISKRMKMKKIITSLEKENPAVKQNIFRSLQRIKTDRLH